MLERLLLGIGSFAVAVLAMVSAEALMRWRAPGYLAETRGLHVFSDTYGWIPRSDSSVVIQGSRVSLNSSGYRGRELAASKPPGVTRVVVLGDSIAFGLDVSDEQTFTHLLDTRDNGIEAANLAVQGYGPDQELIALVNKGLRLNPDIVVLAFCLANDLAEAVLPFALYDGKTPKPRFRFVEDRLVLDDSRLRQAAALRAVQWLNDHSHLYNRLAALVSRPGSAPDFPWREAKREALRDEEYALRLNLAIIRRVSAVCREHGISLLLAAFPNETYQESKPQLSKRFLEAVEAQGVTVVDMADRFKALGESFAAVSLDGVGHLRPFGHAITAQVLEGELQTLAHRSAAAQGR
ncbi:MAG: SGNH/GDSL hydrolase family protein [Burkholderiales bacterium]